MKFPTVDELKNFIIEKGCFERDENMRILHSIFIPCYKTFNQLSRYFNFNKKKVLDLGCGYGEFLINFDESSSGIDVQDRLLKFAGSLGLSVTRLNVEENLDLAEKFDVVFAGQLLDHLVAPHKLLVESRQVLKDEGYLIACVDNIDFLLSRRVSEQHLYGFNLKSLKVLLQRSGFDIVKLFTLTSNKPKIVETVINASPVLLSRSMLLYAIAAKDLTYKYPERRFSWFSPSWLPKELE
ncbi:MAG TPA: class I SAM-dependent methyltransferase [Dehalococcoidales bacterium]|nr:class I SAM-dependent methyltransferase [Dehalococcoidales bacterium]